MRVAYFSDTFLPQINGVSNTLSYLKKHLDKRGIEYRFHVPDYEDEANNADPRVISSKAIPFPLYNDCRLTLPWLPRLIHFMDEFKPDLIHLVTEFGIGLMGRYYARSRNVPIVSSYHTNIDSYIDYYPSLSLLKSGVDEYFKWFHSESERIFVPTDETKNRLHSLGYGSLDIWSRGIDTELFNPNKRSDEFRAKYALADRTVILYVGRVAPEKDIDMLRAAMRLTQQNERVMLVVTGDGPSLSSLKEQASERTVFTGFLRGDALAQAYASADVFFTPSSTETFGNVALEAMASGLPVVAANAGGFRNIVHHGVDGLLCPARDEDAFFGALCRLAEHADYARQLGYAALLQAKKRSWDSILDGLLRGYDDALQGYRRMAC